MAQISAGLFMPLRLLWSWRSLPEIAMVLGAFPAALWGGLGAGILFGGPVVVLFAGLNEPYATYGQFFGDTFGRGAIVWFAVPTLVWMIVSLVLARTWGTETGLRSARTRVIVLSPVLLVPFTAIWLPVALLAKGSVDVLGPKPAWTDSALLGIAGSCLTFPLVFGAFSFVVFWAVEQVDRLWVDGHCRLCGYDCSGLGSANVCPECGKVLPDKPEQAPLPKKSD